MTKITDLAALTGASVDAASDLITVVDVSETGAARNKKMLFSEIPTGIGLGTGNSPQFTAVNIGHASDTTITRTGAGDIAVEGNAIYRAGGTDVPVADGGTGASTAAGARTNLGATTVGANVFTLTNPSAITFLRVNADNTVDALSASAFRTAIGAGTGSGSGDLLAANNLSDLANAATARTNLGVGTGDSPQFTAINIGHASDTTVTRTGAGDIAVEGNAIYRAGGTDVPVTDGGTGASSASAARTNLGVVIGTDVQAYSAVLAAIASSTYDAAIKPLEFLEIALSDETTALTTGDGKASWFFGYDFTITEIYAALGAAQSSSGVVTVDVNKSGSTILLTKASIGASQNTSLSGSGSVSPVISTATSSKGDKFTADLDAAGTGAKGLKLIVIGHRT